MPSGHYHYLCYYIAFYEKIKPKGKSFMMLHALFILNFNLDSKEKFKVSDSKCVRVNGRSPFTLARLCHRLQIASSLYRSCYFNLASVCLCHPKVPEESILLY